MDDSPKASPRGRAAASNPANRFERIEVELEEPAPERVETLYLRDASRSVISRNDSPDVPFDASLNPYRGCEHGCIYCLAGSTSILMGDGTTRPLEEIRPGDVVYGTARRGRYRKYVRTRVVAHWEVRRPAYRVLLRDGTELVAGGDHRFLTERGWKFVRGDMRGRGRRPHLTTNNRLMGTGRFHPGPDTTDGDYRRGYLAGLIRGDGHLAHGGQHQFRLALTDTEALDRATRYLTDHGVAVNRSIEGIRTDASAAVARIEELVAWPREPSVPWRLGYLAGFYDAEGACDGMVVRVVNASRRIVDMFTDALRYFGFQFAIEQVSRRGAGRGLEVVRLRGGIREVLRFWHSIDNAILRKRELEGRSLISDADLSVEAVEPLGEELRLYDITTESEDFIANGVVSHNCYARPTHEYLGFSAGLDFETRIMVKEDAPDLLAREMDSPRWTPQFLGLSGVTDPYQPIERKLEITRRCLEVLVAYRNPVGIVTKNALVRRDADLLAELAGFGAAGVYLSITTLDPEVARLMEPRTSHPRDRLAAIRELTERGIPCGVLVAPVVPGLTDSEIPEILRAAAAAGARSAGFIPLRLPGAVAPLFEAWLDEHFPDRKKRVLNRVRDMRGGRLNDARFGKRMKGEGAYAEQMKALFDTTRRKLGMEPRGMALSTEHFRRPGGHQLGLF